MKKILYNYLKPETTVIRMQTESFICQSPGNTVRKLDDYEEGGDSGDGFIF
ncbi:MAG: hypothetical protein IK041_02695 [Bacteroidales bacterium]|nr:hypothetical protein [Bacteroidales bacterium]